MEERTTYLPVNWMDGMKINKDHFISTDQYIGGQVQQLCSSFLNPFNYGLLHPENGNGPSLSIQTFLDNQGYVHVRVNRLSAVTRDGSRIEIGAQGQAGDGLSALLPQLEFSPEEGSQEPLYLCLSVNLYERIPCGTSDPDEKPPRLPFAAPGYHLSIHSPSQKKTIATGHSLIIGKLNFTGDKPVLDEGFIPACRAIGCHPALGEFYATVMKLLGQLEIDVVDILRSINDKKQTTSIAVTVAAVSDAILGFLGNSLGAMLQTGRYQPPVYLFEQLASLARTINNSINKQSAADKEELYNYIEDWSNLKQGDFESMLRDTALCGYDHDDISPSLGKALLFIQAVSRIFNTLSNLNFIGKKKDRQIFVKEQKEKPGSSFLVD